MKLPDGTVLMHGSAPYDPVKAHEYYLKTRELKGRKKGSAAPPPSKVPVKGLGTKPKKPTNPQELARQRQYAAKRVAEIKSKLADLNARLKKAMADAKEAEAKSKKPPTAAEKAKAARDAEKYRDKHKSELKAKGKKAAAKESASDKPKHDSVESLKKTISEVKGRLAAAVAAQRALS